MTADIGSDSMHKAVYDLHRPALILPARKTSQADKCRKFSAELKVP